MSSEFIMQVLENPQGYTEDQKKIAIKKAIELLDTMEFTDPMGKPPGDIKSKARYREVMGWV